MFPSFNLFGIVPIHTFGLIMSIAFILFFFLLHFYSQRANIAKPVFSSIISFTVVSLLMGRIVYILSEWRSEKFRIQQGISGDVGFFDFLKEIIVMNNYNISLIGGIIGFLLVFLYKTRKNTKTRAVYTDVIVMSFLGAAILGYIGAFVGGEIVGIFYNGVFATRFVDDNATRFPLALLYALGSAMIFAITLTIKKHLSVPKGVAGYSGILLFGVLMFLGEFLNDHEDIFESIVRFGINQIGAIIMIGYGIYALFFKKHVD